MYAQNLQEHLKKEALKTYVDSCPNFSDFVKRDLKLLIDTNEVSEALVQKILMYFAGIRG